MMRLRRVFLISTSVGALALLAMPAEGADPDADIAVSADGALTVVTGTTLGIQTDSDFTTIAYGPDGGRLWVNSYDGPASDYDDANAIAMSPTEGTVFVAGASRGTEQGMDYATIAYAADGSELWVQRYDGLRGSDGAIDVAVSLDGSRVYVTGRSQGTDGDPDIVTIAYDTSGNVVWQRRYDGPASLDDKPSHVAVSPTGRSIYVAGESDGRLGKIGDPDYVVIKYASDGAREWVRRYNPSSNYDSAYALTLGPSGYRIYVTGASRDRDGVDVATLAYSADGTRLWARRYNGPADGRDRGIDLAASPDGRKLFVASRSSGESGDPDFAVIAYRVDGTRLWVRRYNGPFDREDAPEGITTSPDARAVFVTGWSRSKELDCDYLTLKYSADGTLRWIRRYGNEDAMALEDTAAAFAMAPGGNRIYVTGRSEGYSVPADSDTDFATIAYRVDGQRLWIRRYDSPSPPT